MRIDRVLLVGFGVFQSACAGGAEGVIGDDLVVLEGATLFDGAAANVLEDAAIVLNGRRILAVGQVGDFEYPGDASRVDVSGRFIVPGLIDVHAHMFEEFPQPLLAFGVTTVRSPGSGGDEGVEGASLGVSLRDALNAGRVVGPRMVTAGRIINNSDVLSPLPDRPEEGETGTAGGYLEVRTEGEIRAEVRAQAEAGYDLIKLYLGIGPQLLRAAVDEAHELGLRVVGHLEATSWTTAATSGIDGLLHSCSEGPSWELAEGPEAVNGLSSSWAESLRTWASTANSVPLEGPRWDELIEALLANRTEVNPTLVTFEALYWADESPRLSEAQPDFAPPGYASQWSGHWESQADFMVAQGFTTADLDALRAAFPACLRMVKAMYESGVLITAGDDLGGWMTPGVSFHRELQLLAEAGISPQDVLRVATHNGATALGLDDEVGTVEPGKRADMIVLRADPLVDIANTLSIEAVYKDGQRFHPGELLAASR